MDGEVSSGKKNPKSGDSGTLAQEIMSGYRPTMEKLGLLPTPAAADGHKTTSNSRQKNLNMLAPVGYGSQLNPLFVMEMMGFPPDWTELPFQNGEMNQ